MQRGITIAYQGRPGAFSELAVKRIRPDGEPVPYPDFPDVINAVISGDAALGLLPVRNSTAGVIARSCGLIGSEPVIVTGEVELPISHALIAVPGVALGQIKRVVTHPVALAQCRQYLAAHSEIKPVAMGDTAGCVEWIMDQNARDTAAIASAHTAAMYGASILVEGIEDSPSNSTSFMLIESAVDAVKVTASTAAV